LAIRAAVGAGRLRLVRQLLTESLLLAGIGSLAGLAVTVWGMKVLVLLIPENLPRLRAVQIDLPTLSFTLLISIGTAVAIGLVPAWQAGRTSVSNALKRAGSGATMSGGWRRYRAALVITEVALALVLLAATGLMIQSVIRLLHVEPGFDSENLLFVHPGLLRGEKYYEAKTQNLLYADLHERFAALPGVKAVGIAKLGFFQLGFAVEGHDEPMGFLPAGSGVGESDLFRAMRVPLLAGRYFEKADIGEKVGTVIINDTMARLCWPAQSALNKKFRSKEGRVFEVIGVVGDCRIDRYDETVEPTYYRPYHEQSFTGGRGPFFMVRTERDPAAMIAAIRDALKSVETSMTTPWFQIVRQTLYDATQASRTYMLYLVIFASVGLVLASLGIYGVLAYSVARRTREIGIRMAVGAERRHVLRMVMAEGGRLVIIGIAFGLIAAFWLTRLLRHQLFHVSPTEPHVFAAVVLVLSAVASVACFLPARRATRINPMEALRYE
jgi:putative ABC transport system permease protein